MRDFGRDEKGQATVEYILLIAFALFIFVTFFRGIIGPLVAKTQTGLTKKIEQAFTGDNLHHLTFGR